MLRGSLQGGRGTPGEGSEIRNYSHRGFWTDRTRRRPRTTGAGDLIIGVNGQEVRSSLDIGRQLAGCNPGDLVPFLPTRDGVEHARNISLMPRQSFSAP